MVSQKDPCKTESHAGNDFCILDPPGFIAPSAQDFILTDIDEQSLHTYAERLGVEYLGPAQFPGSFPLGPSSQYHLPHQYWPVTYLSEKAMRALLPENRSDVPTVLEVYVHQEAVIECRLSGKDKHFADVNVLGSDYFADNRLSLMADYVKKTCVVTDERIG
eukprot:jgi/Hompol1/1929/HPOL_005804-RA